MADLSITAANVAASANATIRREYTFGATITAGQAVYLNASNQWVLAEANTGVGNGTTTLRGIALNGGALNQPASVVTADPAFVPGATLTVGQTYVVSAAVAGNIAPISDLASTNFPVILFVATTASAAVMTTIAGGAAKP